VERGRPRIRELGLDRSVDELGRGRGLVVVSSWSYSVSTNVGLVGDAATHPGLPAFAHVGLDAAWRRR